MYDLALAEHASLVKSLRIDLADIVRRFRQVFGAGLVPVVYDAKAEAESRK
jgi:hypothetical protein